MFQSKIMVSSKNESTNSGDYSIGDKFGRGRGRERNESETGRSYDSRSGNIGDQTNGIESVRRTIMKKNIVGIKIRHNVMLTKKLSL